MNILHNHEFLRCVSCHIGGGFYIFDGQRFEDNFLSLRDGLREHHPNSEVAYAFKANYMPEIARILLRLNGMAEVASRFEYDVASTYLPTDRLIFNGPVKRKEDLRLALSGGSIVNIDSFREIRWLKELCGEFSSVDIGMRVSFPFQGKQSRFGFQIDNGELDRALSDLRELKNVNVSSLHCHFSTRDKSIEGYKKRIHTLVELAQRLSGRYRLYSLNIGGGFFGEMPEALKAQFSVTVPTIHEYADEIGKTFAKCSSELMLVVEPGVSMVANTMSLVAEVIEIRQRNGSLQALLNTSINSVNPTHSTHKPLMCAVNARQAVHLPSRDYRLIGNTCMEHDIISDHFTARLEEGDYVQFKNRGAYSINYTPPFITAQPGIVNTKGRILKYPDDASTILISYR